VADEVCACSYLTVAFFSFNFEHFSLPMGHLT
jgi:hypothetical protein